MKMNSKKRNNRLSRAQDSLKFLLNLICFGHDLDYNIALIKKTRNKRRYCLQQEI